MYMKKVFFLGLLSFGMVHNNAVFVEGYTVLFHAIYLLAFTYLSSLFYLLEGQRMT